MGTILTCSLSKQSQKEEMKQHIDLAFSSNETDACIDLESGDSTYPNPYVNRETWLCRSTIGAGSDLDEDEEDEEDEPLHLNAEDSSNENPVACDWSHKPQHPLDEITGDTLLSMSSTRDDEEFKGSKSIFCDTNIPEFGKKLSNLNLPPKCQLDQQIFKDQSMMKVKLLSKQKNEQSRSKNSILSTSVVYGFIFTSSSTFYAMMLSQSDFLRRVTLNMEIFPLSSFFAFFSVLLGIAYFIGVCIAVRVTNHKLLVESASLSWLAGIVSFHLPFYFASIPAKTFSLLLALVLSLFAHGVLTTVLVAYQSKRIHQSLSYKFVPKCLMISNISGALMQAFGLLFYSFEDAFNGSKQNVGNTTQSNALVRRGGFMLVLFFSFLLVGILIGLKKSTFKNLAQAQDERKQQSAKVTMQVDAHAIKSKLLENAKFPVTLTCCFIAIGIGMICTISSYFFAPEEKTDMSIRHPQTELNMIASILIALPWFALLFISSQPRNFSNLFFDRSIGTKEKMYPSLFLLCGCAFVFVNFVRGQLNTLFPIQLCQTNRSIRGGHQIHPDTGAILATITSVTFMLFLCSKRRQIVAPARKVAIGIFVCLVGLFLSGILELYRRRMSNSFKDTGFVVLSWPKGECKKITDTFSFLWAIPVFLLVGCADSLVSCAFLKQFCDISGAAFSLGISALLQGVGISCALAISNASASWFFLQLKSDLVVCILLSTTVAAATYLFLKRSNQTDAMLEQCQNGL